MMSALTAVPFETVSMNFIFALPGQTYNDLRSDIDEGFSLGANHVAIHPFIDFTFTKSPVNINTFDVKTYCERIRSDKLTISLTIRFTRRQKMIYWLFWTAYSTSVKESYLKKFFGMPLKKIYGFAFWIVKQLGFIKEQDGTYEMTRKGVFYYYYYENFYTLFYIDKMWGIMRKEAFRNRSNCKRIVCAKNK